MKRIWERIYIWAEERLWCWREVPPWRPWQCFILGHKITWDNDCGPEYYWEAYCPRCFMNWPQDATDIPRLLNRAYVWAVDHGFPEWLDLWLGKCFRPPDWWEY